MAALSFVHMSKRGEMRHTLQLFNCSIMGEIKMKMVLQQKQMLKMVMTTELRQAIELLQLSTYELLQFIQEQAEENPFIELVEKEDYHVDFERRPRKSSYEQHENPIDFTAKYEKNMHDYLLDQIIWLQIEEKDYKLIHYLILNINEQGYLTIEDEEICKHFNINELELKKAKNILHQLEPKGIGASNLAECLLIQAKVMYPNDHLLFSLIEHYLQLIADKQWEKIEKQLNISLDKVKELYDKIQTLNPKPGSNLSAGKVDYVLPDIFVVLNDKNNTYSIQLNDYYLPTLTFNEQYSSGLINSKELRPYVREQFKKFEWLQKSIEQRRSTILKIMNVIISKQWKFLQNGFSSLKPLTLKEVADEINMHESTVSRATANKIVQTPVGTFELRHLFSTKLTTQTGDNTSQTKVKAILQEMINQENKSKPLSDQKIADQLKENKGIVISRRTVAKYRDELHIPSSSKRKEIKLYRK